MRLFRRFGPGFLVTAAFIGPGTVTTASLAGAEFKFHLLWTVIFAVIAAIVLQEMAARLGLVSRLGLGEAVRKTFQNFVLRILACLFIVLAIGFGNAAYQTGNLTGAAQGITMLLGGHSYLWVLLISGVAFVVLFFAKFKLIQGILIGLVALMSLLFVATAVMVRPSPLALLQGLFVPNVPDGGLTTIIGLIGTTVVPYNLFLHADSARENWPTEAQAKHSLGESRLDTLLSVSVGGIITLAIIITAAAAFYGRITFTKLADVADQLQPLLGGTGAMIAFAIGLLAAGLTSAVTAPLAASYAVSGVLGWNKNLSSWPFRIVWMVVLGIGAMFAIIFGASPTQTILVAQVANGLLLPIIALFLLIVVNRSDLMGDYRNRVITNVLGSGVVLVAAVLGVWKIVGEMQKVGVLG